MLRRAVAADLDVLLELAAHPSIARMLAFDAAAGITEALSSDAGELLVIEAAGVRVGGVRWELTNRRSRIAEIRSLMLDPGMRGRGLATDAVRELVSRVFDAGLHRVEAEVLGANVAAQRVFERAGFVREGVRRRAYDREGAWQDGVCFGLLADEVGMFAR
jgi:RimJ/RimL family protein N-acetyltransferase